MPARRPVISAFLTLLLALCVVLPAVGRAEDWKEVATTKDLIVSTRPRPGSPIAEVRAVGRIEASPATVKAVLEDRDHYPQFMPYVSEVRVLTTNPAAHTLLVYMRLDPPIVGERDYTISVREEARPGGGSFTTWQIANDKGPPEKSGIVRVKISEGSWLLEPEDGGKATRATYTLFTDAGGSVPAFVVNQANKRSLNDLFTAVRKTAADPKYRR